MGALHSGQPSLRLRHVLRLMSRSRPARVLYGVSTWGLGHATRSLPVIQRLLDGGCRVSVVSTGRSLTLIQHELGDRCTYHDLPDIQPSASRFGALFAPKFVALLPHTLRRIRAERAWAERYVRHHDVDLVVTDGRYGVASARVPSFVIAHQLRFISPGRVAAAERLLEYVNARLTRGFVRVLVPDYPEGSTNLSGAMSHQLAYFHADRLRYIGQLSRIQRRPSVPGEELDLFVSISGAEPQRSLLERELLRQIPPGLRTLIALGKPEARGAQESSTASGARVVGYLDQAKQEQAMNAARTVITRAGYTTVMELAELGKRAVLIPTPGQTEQEYLGAYHARRGQFALQWQGKIDVRAGLAEVERTQPPVAPHPTSSSIDALLEVIRQDTGFAPPRASAAANRV